MNDVEDLAAHLGRAVFTEVAASAICRDLSVAQVHAICQQVASAALTMLRQTLVGAGTGLVGSTEVGGESVVAPLAATEEREQ